MSSASTTIETQSPRWRWWQAALLAAFILLALAPLDLPVARWCYRVYPPRSFVRVLEFVANVAGRSDWALVPLGIAILLSGTKLSRVPHLISVALGGGLLAVIIKLCISRARPHSTDLSVATFTSTFHGVFPLFSARSGLQSFPSGHSATAIGVAIALTMLFPRGRWFFGLLAATTAISRIIVHAHFPTDVAAGLMIGAWSAYAGRYGFMAPVFAWCERGIDGMFSRRRSFVPQKLDGTAAEKDSDRRTAA